MERFRQLLKKEIIFQWLPDHEQAFHEAKRRLCTTPILTYYDMNRETLLATDASRLNGIGFVLLQKVGDTWKPVQAGSRFLSPAESRYAMIELEALGACWAMKKCNMFLQGLPNFTLLTDHQPLIPILNSMGISDVENPRLQRLMMKMLPYSFTAKWIKGKDHLAADALSRYPTEQPSFDDELCETHSEAAVKVHFADKALQDVHLQKLREGQKADPQICPVVEYVKSGWPDTFSLVNPLAKPFWSVRHNLYLAPLEEESILLMNGRTVIPSSLQRGMLLLLHEGHQGVEKTRRRTRDSVYWPGIDKQIEEMVKRCSPCDSLLSVNAKEALKQPPLPTRPWEKLGADLYSLNGNEYLVVTDYVSFFNEVYDLKKNTKAPMSIQKMKKLFSRFGKPIEVVSDGGSQFNSKVFADFAKQWSFRHTFSSP